MMRYFFDELVSFRMIDWKTAGGLTLAFMVISADIAWARGGHGHHRHRHFDFGISIGGPGLWYGPGFYGPGFYGGYSSPFWNTPYYRPPPPVVVPITPPVYIQQEQSRMALPPTGYWYYCLNPEGYYPDVRDCSNGWIPVAPQSTAQ